MSDYCRYCEEDAIKERIADLKRLNPEYEGLSDSEVQDEIEDEIGLCYDCTKEQDADDFKGEGWD